MVKMEQIILCERQFSGCEKRACGTINNKCVCLRCLEWGEKKDFVKFEQ
jgi:hypothetical protein